MKANGIDYYSDLTKVEKTIQVYKELLRENIENKNIKWEALLNVNELLEECQKSEQFHLALVTGNVREGAKMKLESAGINTQLFMKNQILFGGFGSDHIDRILFIIV